MNTIYEKFLANFELVDFWIIILDCPNIFMCVTKAEYRGIPYYDADGISNLPNRLALAGRRSFIGCIDNDMRCGKLQVCASKEECDRTVTIFYNAVS